MLLASSWLAPSKQPNFPRSYWENHKEGVSCSVDCRCLIWHQKFGVKPIGIPNQPQREFLDDFKGRSEKKQSQFPAFTYWISGAGNVWSWSPATMSIDHWRVSGPLWPWRQIVRPHPGSRDGSDERVALEVQRVVFLWERSAAHVRKWLHTTNFWWIKRGFEDLFG